MKYQSIVQKVDEGEYKLVKVRSLLENATKKLEEGDFDAQQVVDACNNAIFALTAAGKRVARAKSVLDSDNVVRLQKYLNTGFTMLEGETTRRGHYLDTFGAKFGNSMSWGAVNKDGALYLQTWASAFREVNGKLFARVTYKYTPEGQARTNNTWSGQRNNQIDAWLSGECEAYTVPALGYRKSNGNMVTTHLGNDAFRLVRNVLDIEGDVWAETKC